MRKVIVTLLELLFFAAFGVFLAMVLIEWMAGCGETYVSLDGSTHHYECIFVPTHESP